MPFVHQAQQLALAEHGVVELQTRELDLLGRIFKAGLAHQPVVDVPVVLELERAQRAGDAFDRVGQPVRKIIQRIQAPLVAATVVRRMTNAQQQRVAHDHVRMRHVDLRAQHVRAIGELARLHAAQQVEILLGVRSRIRTVGPRRW